MTAIRRSAPNALEKDWLGAQFILLAKHGVLHRPRVF